jgi:hypothetical protein
MESGETLTTIGTCVSWADYGQTHIVFGVVPSTDPYAREQVSAAHQAAFSNPTACRRMPRRVSGAATYGAGVRPSCKQCLRELERREAQAPAEPLPLD